MGVTKSLKGTHLSELKSMNIEQIKKLKLKKQWQLIKNIFDRIQCISIYPI